MLNHLYNAIEAICATAGALAVVVICGVLIYGAIRFAMTL